MMARSALCLGGVLSGCHPGVPSASEPEPSTLAEVPPAPDLGRVSESQDDCTLADRPCPDLLPKLGPTAFPAAAWAAVAQQVSTGILTVRWRAGEPAVLTLSCRPPGQYHEVVADPSSPGRGWAADRIFFRPEEMKSCDRATHAVVALVSRARGSADDGHLPPEHRGLRRGAERTDPLRALTAGPSAWPPPMAGRQTR